MKSRYIMFLIFLMGVSCQRSYKNPFDTRLTLQPVPDFQAIVKGESIELQWTTHDQIKTGYLIEKKSFSDATWESIPIENVSQTTYLDTAIMTDITYTYRILGISDENETPFSQSVSITAPFPSPDNLMVETLTDTSVRLTWIDHCSFETGYSVCIVKQNQADTTRFELNSDTEQLRVETLDPDYDYDIEISAFTRNNRSGLLPGRLSFEKDFQWYRTLSGQTQTISSCCFFNYDQYLATGSHDNTVSIWSTKDWHLINSTYGDVQDSQNQVTALAFCSPNNLTIGNQNGSVSIWNVFAWNQTSSLNPNSYTLNDLFISEDQQSIFAAKYKYIYVWSTGNWEYKKTLTGHTGSINSLALAQEKQLFVSGGEDDLIHVWSLAGLSFLQNVTGHTGDITTLCFSQDETLLATGSQDQTVKIWSVDTWQQIESLNLTGMPEDLLFSQDDKWLICAMDSLKIWSTSSWQASTLLTDLDTATITSLAITQNGQWLAAGDSYGEVFILSTAGQWRLQ